MQSFNIKFYKLVLYPISYGSIIGLQLPRSISLIFFIRHIYEIYPLNFVEFKFIFMREDRWWKLIDKLSIPVCDILSIYKFLSSQKLLGSIFN